MKNKVNMKASSATALLQSFGTQIANAQGSGASYEGWAAFIQKQYDLTPAQWGFLVDLWELTCGANQEIHIESLNEAR